MYKSELVQAVARDLDMPDTSVRQVLDTIVGKVVEATQRGEKVVLSGFGSFQRRQRSPRQGLDPQGRPFQVPTTTTLAFVASERMRTSTHEG